MSVVILNCSLYGTGNQCSCLSAGVMCARRSKPSTMRAASFWTSCSRKTDQERITVVNA